MLFLGFGSSSSLSLAMFEALRGLRDAVAPESGNVGATDSDQPDFEEFWQSYRSNDTETVAAVLRITGGVPPQKREDYARIYQKWEREKDANLVAQLASTVLQKSDDIAERVSALPGMDRTKQMQLERIAELLDENQQADTELQELYATAQDKRRQVRQTIHARTCDALGIQEFKI